MKKSIFAALVIASSFCLEAQQPASQPQQPAVPAQPASPPTDVPRGSATDNLPPGRAFNPTNPPNGRPFAVSNAAPPFGASLSNRFGASNSLTPTGATATNRFAMTNATGMGSTQSMNFSGTNTLSTMAPAQAQNVIQVQNGLNSLQNLAVNIGGIQNVQQVIQQNPQIQQQLQQVQTQISSLAQGQTKPSDESVQRLCLDLFRTLSRARLTPENHLILAISINAACNSQNLSSAQIEQVIDNGLVTLQTAGAPLSVAHTVGCDMHSIAFELQPNLSR